MSTSKMRGPQFVWEEVYAQNKKAYFYNPVAGNITIKQSNTYTELSFSQRLIPVCTVKIGLKISLSPRLTRHGEKSGTHIVLSQ